MEEFPRSLIMTSPVTINSRGPDPVGTRYEFRWEREKLPEVPFAYAFPGGGGATLRGGFGISTDGKQNGIGGGNWTFWHKCEMNLGAGKDWVQMTANLNLATTIRLGERYFNLGYLGNSGATAMRYWIYDPSSEDGLEWALNCNTAGTTAALPLKAQCFFELFMFDVPEDR
jgi:hypothetical protein